MKKRNLQPFGIIILSLATLLCSISQVQAADASNDTLLNMIPEDCMFCVRINNLNGTLGKLDQYLLGVSNQPIPVTLMVNMQLGAVIGDPMLTGIDQGGDFAFFAVSPQPDQKEPVAGLLIPVTDYKTFVQTNPNCKEGEDGIAILATPNSPVGNFTLAMTEASDGKYALVVSLTKKAMLPVLKEAINTKSKPLAKKLEVDESETAATSPAWVYVNLAGLYEKYNEDAFAGIKTLQQEMEKDLQNAPGNMANVGEMMGIYFKMLPELFKQFGGGLDSATIALTPEPTALTLDVTTKTKDGSELAEAFIKNSKATGNYKMTGYLDDKNAINGTMKMNIPSLKKIYDMVFETIDKTSDDSKFKAQMAEFKKSLDTTYDAMGDEVAFSFSYAGGKPPFKFQEIVEITKPDIMKEYMQEGMGFANEMYKSMGIPAELKYEPGVSTYKNATIDVLSISFDVSDDPNAIKMQQEIEKIYGDSLKYYMTQTSDKFYMVMGPDGEQTLKNLIDVPASTVAPAGDIKTAMDTLQNTSYNDFVCSINVIKLMKGMGEMMQSMNQPSMDMAAGMFANLKDVQSQSCLVTGGSITDGQASLRLVVPKQHLVEIVAAAMQIKQHAMKSQQQMMQNPQPGMMSQGAKSSMGSASGQMPPSIQKAQDPLQSWVGKKAPELKMIDLDGKIHRVSRLKGKKVILDFWATWCPPCKKSIPDLIKLANSGDSDLAILGLSDEPTDKLTAFVKKAKMNYPVVAYKEKLPAPYGQITGLPTLFLIDSEGIIRGVLVGYDGPEELQSCLKKIK